MASQIQKKSRKGMWQLPFRWSSSIKRRMLKKYYAVNGSVLRSVNDVLLAGEAIPKSSLYTP